jgi:RNA polymerase sigma-70 factor, ECF subfamily
LSLKVYEIGFDRLSVEPSRASSLLRVLSRPITFLNLANRVPRSRSFDMAVQGREGGCGPRIREIGGEPNAKASCIKWDRQPESEWNPMHDDEQIIARVLAGDAEAYRCLVERHERSVFGFVKELVRNMSDVEDLAQEVFVAAFTHLASFDGRRAKFSTWLLTIARNRCCNHLKKRLLPTGEMADMASRVPPPDRVAANRETWNQLDDALDKLPLEQRTAFVLAEIQELPLAEIAVIEGVPLGTVKSRVSRAKERLRQSLKDLQPVEAKQSGPQLSRSHS